MLRQLVVSDMGVFSGQLVLSGTAHSVSGAFDLSGHARKTVQAGGPIVLDMYLDWNSSSPNVYGTVSSSSWVAELTAGVVDAKSTPGQFTIVAPGGIALTNEFSYFMVTNNGVNVVMSGMLADGTALSPVSSVVGDEELPVYASLYNGAGVLTGWISLTNEIESSILTWTRQGAPGSVGFTNVMPVRISQWIPPAPKTAAVAFTTNNPGVIELSGANLPEPLIFNVAVLANNSIVKLPGSPTNSFSGTIDPKTGGFKITFGTTGNTTATGSGAILQSDNSGFGVFSIKTHVGTIFLGRSNSVY
jgi:hypothetical protein